MYKTKIIDRVRRTICATFEVSNEQNMNSTQYDDGSFICLKTSEVNKKKGIFKNVHSNHCKRCPSVATL